MAVVYSCCFWFSLRLGGILIAVFSILQSLVVLISCCVAYSQEQNLKDSIAALIDSLDLIYTKPYLDSFYTDPQKYLSLGIIFTCLYIIICLSYAYGAYKFNNILMIGYILVELLRLISMTFLIITWLLVLKENTMDIGIHIGTSVAGSFFLLGMFYLWICAANLPILINEMERDQQNATIYKLQQMLDTVKTTSKMEVETLDTNHNLRNAPVFATTNFQKNIFFRRAFDKGSQHPLPFYSNFNR